MSSGDRIWTCDLRVMSPTSFQTAPPRVIMKLKWMEKDSNLRRHRQQIYSLSPLATRESIHKRYIYVPEPMSGLEPLTCWLQISCSANWATSAYTRFQGKWDWQGSNLWPPACKAGALPAELWSHICRCDYSTSAENDPDRVRTDDLRRDRAAL